MHPAGCKALPWRTSLEGIGQSELRTGAESMKSRCRAAPSTSQGCVRLTLRHVCIEQTLVKL